MDNKELAEQWRKMPHGIAEVVEKLIFLKLNAFPFREDICYNPDMLKLRDKIYEHFSEASDHLCEAFYLAKSEIPAMQ